jgi:hypothetical protein
MRLLLGGLSQSSKPPFKVTSDLKWAFFFSSENLSTEKQSSHELN